MIIRVTAVAALAFAASSAGAADQLFRGLDLNPGLGVPPPPFVNADAARAAFTAAAGATAVQDFESFAVGPVPASFPVGSVTTSFTSLSDIGTSVRSTPFFDAFATSGTNYILSEVTEGVTFWQLGFDTPQRAAGFTHTDAADWLGTPGIPSLQVILDAGLSTERTFDLTLEDPVTVPSGSVGFFGIITDDAFSTLAVFRPVGGGNTDVLGLDDLTLVVPAPGSALMLGLAAIAGAGRRRR